MWHSVSFISSAPGKCCDCGGDQSGKHDCEFGCTQIDCKPKEVNIFVTITSLYYLFMKPRLFFMRKLSKYFFSKIVKLPKLCQQDLQLFQKGEDFSPDSLCVTRRRNRKSRNRRTLMESCRRHSNMIRAEYK